MSKPVKPVAKTVYICDDVVGDPNTGKVSILNIWETVNLPAGTPFPYRLAKLCVFAWWRGGLGSVNTRVDVVDASTGKAIRRTKDYLLHFPDRFFSVFARYKIEHCEFPHPGKYYVELYCENGFVDDQAIQVLLF